MVKTLVEGSVEWFKSVTKLPNHGLDIKKKLANDNIVSVVDYKAIFGKRKRSNGLKLDICCDPNVVTRVQELYEVVYQKKKITNGTTGVTFTKVVIFEKGGKDVNWALYATQVQSMGTKRHKNRGSVDNEHKKKVRSSRGIYSPFVICLDSLGAKRKEIIDTRVMYFNEKRNPRTPEANK
jgi:hypothetical protein